MFHCLVLAPCYLLRSNGFYVVTLQDFPFGSVPASSRSFCVALCLGLSPSPILLDYRDLGWSLSGARLRGSSCIVTSQFSGASLRGQELRVCVLNFVVQQISSFSFLLVIPGSLSPLVGTRTPAVGSLPKPCWPRILKNFDFPAELKKW